VLKIRKKHSVRLAIHLLSILLFVHLFTFINISHRSFATWYTFEDSPCKVVVSARQSIAEDYDISFWTSGTWWRDASQPLLHVQYDKSNGTATCPAGTAHNRFRACYAYQFDDTKGIDGILLGGCLNYTYYINWVSAWPGQFTPDGDMIIPWSYFEYENKNELKQTVLDYCQNKHDPSIDTNIRKKNFGTCQ
jgi:hypothetical protein